MNEIEEQRVIEALRAITGGLTVTEQDIIDAGTRMRPHVNGPSPRRNRAMLAVAAAVVLIVGIVAVRQLTGNEKSAPSPADRPSAVDTLKNALQDDTYTSTDDEFTAGAQPTARDLSGIWLLREPFRSALVVNGDLDWSYESVHEDRVASSSLAGRTWTRNLGRGGVCGFTGPESLGSLPWTTSMARDGSLHLQFAGETNMCSPGDDREVWDRLAPGPSPVLDYLRATVGTVVWTAPAAPNWSGLYLNTETGHLIELDVSGTYVYLDSVTGDQFTPSDEGTYQVRASKSTITGTCGGGSFSASFEVGTSRAVAGYLQSYDVLRIGDGGEACSPGIGTAGVWLRLA